MSSNATVYVGFWTNYSKGAIVGSTLTLTNRNGAVLIAALAIFIQVSKGYSFFTTAPPCNVPKAFGITNQLNPHLAHRGAIMEHYLLRDTPSSSNYVQPRWVISPTASATSKQQIRYQWHLAVYIGRLGLEETHHWQLPQIRLLNRHRHPAFHGLWGSRRLIISYHYRWQPSSSLT